MQESVDVHPNKPFERRMKRQLKAPAHRLAAVVPQEFSALCKEELHGLGIQESSVTEAGVEFHAKLDTCYLCNLWLRTASRILCRVARFRAGSAEQLFNKVVNFHWELWLNPIIPLSIEAHTRGSRIEHAGLIEKTTLTGIQKRFITLRISPPIEGKSKKLDVPAGESIQRIIIQLRKNYCEISLDSSGAHLHQRGYRLQHTGAPVRETLAAAILLKTGWHGDRPLIDGMCGAGTLPIEASLLARRLPPGLRRRFLFESWPSFMQKTWNFYLREAKEKAHLRCSVPIIAIDQSLDAIAVAKQNAKLAGVQEDILWEQMDFFSYRPQSLSDQKGLLFLNPPYGKRLDGVENLFESLGAHLRQFFRGWQVAVMVHDRTQAIRMQLGQARIWNIRHGGMPVMVVLANL